MTAKTGAGARQRSAVLHFSVSGMLHAVREIVAWERLDIEQNRIPRLTSSWRHTWALGQVGAQAGALIQSEDEAWAQKLLHPRVAAGPHCG